MASNAKAPAYAAGDIIMIRPAQLSKRRKPGTFTPADLCRIGWPNRFQVLAVKTDKAGGAPLLMLDPCCRHMQHPATGEYLCAAHPEEYFQLARAPGKGRKGRPDRQLVVKGPWGDIFRMDYREDDTEPGLEIQAGSGAPLVLGGALSRKLGELFKKVGFF